MIEVQNDLDLAEWCESIRQLLREMEKQDFPFPLSSNILHEPTGDVVILDELLVLYGLPAILKSFYLHCGGVNMHNVWNGYWVFGFEEIAHRVRQGEVRRIKGIIEADVLVFGCNGGGGRFAIVTDGSGSVLYLPSGGDVHSSIWHTDSPFNAPEQLSSNFGGFLKRLHNDLEAFVRGDSTWQYMNSR